MSGAMAAVRFANTASDSKADPLFKYCVLGGIFHQLANVSSTGSVASSWFPCIDGQTKLCLWKLSVLPVFHGSPLGDEDVAVLFGGYPAQIENYKASQWGKMGIDTDTGNHREAKVFSFCHRAPTPASSIACFIGPYVQADAGYRNRTATSCSVQTETLHSMLRSSRIPPSMLDNADDATSTVFALPVDMRPVEPSQKTKLDVLVPLLPGRSSIHYCMHHPANSRDAGSVFHIPPLDTLKINSNRSDAAEPSEMEAKSTAPQLPHNVIRHSMRFIEHFTKIPYTGKHFSVAFSPKLYTPTAALNSSSLSGFWNQNVAKFTSISSVCGGAAIPAETLVSGLQFEEGMQQRMLQVLGISSQWFSLCGSGIAVPASWRDEWLIHGLRGYIAWQYLRETAGDAEYQYLIASANREVCNLDEHHPDLPALRPSFEEDSIFTQGMGRSPQWERLLASKSPLVMHALAGLVGDTRLRHAIELTLLRIQFARTAYHGALLAAMRHIWHQCCALQSTETRQTSATLDLLSEYAQTNPSFSWTCAEIGLASRGPSENSEAQLTLSTSSDGAPTPSNADVASNMRRATSSELAWDRRSGEPCFLLTTETFFRELASICGASIRGPLRQFADFWVYGRSICRVNAGWYYDRKEHKVKIAVQQVAAPGQALNSGSLDIIVQELSSEHSHQLTLSDTCPYTLGSFPCHVKVRQTFEHGRMARRTAKGEKRSSGNRPAPKTHRDQTNDTPVKYVKIDPNYRWIRRIHFLMPALLWKTMLETDSNVGAQLEAIAALGDLTTRSYERQKSKSELGHTGALSAAQSGPTGAQFYVKGLSNAMQASILRSLIDVATSTNNTYYFRVRAAAIEAIALWQTRRMPAYIPRMRLSQSNSVVQNMFETNEGLLRMIQLYRHLFFTPYGTHVFMPPYVSAKLNDSSSTTKKRARKSAQNTSNTTNNTAANKTEIDTPQPQSASTKQTTKKKSSKAKSATKEAEAVSKAKTNVKSLGMHLKRVNPRKRLVLPGATKLGKPSTLSLFTLGNIVQLKPDPQDDKETRTAETEQHTKPEIVSIEQRMEQQKQLLDKMDPSLIRLRYELQKSLLTSISRIRHRDGVTPDAVMYFLLSLADHLEFERTLITFDAAPLVATLIGSIGKAAADCVDAPRFGKQQQRQKAEIVSAVSTRPNRKTTKTDQTDPERPEEEEEVSDIDEMHAKDIEMGNRAIQFIKAMLLADSERLARARTRIDSSVPHHDLIDKLQESQPSLLAIFFNNHKDVPIEDPLGISPSTEGVICATCLQECARLESSGLLEPGQIRYDIYLSSVWPLKVRLAAFDALLTVQFESARIPAPPDGLVRLVHGFDNQGLTSINDVLRKQVHSWFNRAFPSLVSWLSMLEFILCAGLQDSDDRVVAHLIHSLYSIQCHTNGADTFTINTVDIDSRLSQYFGTDKHTNAKSYAEIGLAGIPRSILGLILGIEEPWSVHVPGPLGKSLGWLSQRPRARGAMFILAEPSFSVALSLLATQPALENETKSDLTSDTIRIAERARTLLLIGTRCIESLESVLYTPIGPRMRIMREICHFWHSVWGRNIPHWKLQMMYVSQHQQNNSTNSGNTNQVSQQQQHNSTNNEDTGKLPQTLIKSLPITPTDVNQCLQQLLEKNGSILQRFRVQTQQGLLAAVERCRSSTLATFSAYQQRELQYENLAVELERQRVLTRADDPDGDMIEMDEDFSLFDANDTMGMSNRRSNGMRKSVSGARKVKNSSKRKLGASATSNPKVKRRAM